LPDLDPIDSSDGDLSSADMGNNTIAIKFRAPKDSSRFSLNITTSDGARDGYDDVLFHFNPRQFKKGGQLILNDKLKRVGEMTCRCHYQQCLTCSASNHALLLCRSIRMDSMSLWREFTAPVSSIGGRCLLRCLDDVRRWYCNSQAASVQSLVGTEKVEGVAGVNIHSAVHPRRLFVSGLTKLHTDPEVDLRRAELERAFRKYVDRLDVRICGSREPILALLEMANSGRYQVNEAGRSRHEALIEERAAKEATEGGGSGEGKAMEAVDWD